MNKRIKIFKSILLVLLVFFATKPINSQVTIGTLEPPLKGALLDLKQQVETTGAENSEHGLMHPRVALVGINSLVPMLTTSEDAATIKSQYTGLTVYNVTVDNNFQKGLYVWDGAKWVRMWGGIVADNGLTFANDNIVLGGTLNQPTTIDLNSNDLLFNRSTGNVGIGTTSPKASLHIIDEVNDPLIIDDLKFTSELPNPVDAANTAYFNMQISDRGVVRKSPAVNHISDKYIYTLHHLSPTAANNAISPGGANGSSGSQFYWIKNGQTYDYVTLPEDGAYVFNLRLYGTSSSAGNVATSYYLTAFINSTTGTPADAQEIIVSMPVSAYPKATYSAFLTLSGKANDKIYFKIGETGRLLNWALLGINTGVNGISEDSSNRTSMIFWKI